MEDQRVDRRVRRTRELLRSALLSLILEKGYERVTVRDIIDRADVGRSTFYAHFRDKDDLFLAGFDEFRRLFEPPGSLMDSATTGGMHLWPSARLFEHFWDYRTVWKAMAGKQGSNLVKRHLHELLSEIVRDQLRPRPPSRESQAQVPFDRDPQRATPKARISRPLSTQRPWQTRIWAHHQSAYQRVRAAQSRSSNTASLPTAKLAPRYSHKF